MTLQRIVTQAQRTTCTVHGPPPCPGGGACLRRISRARASGLVPPGGLRVAIRGGLAGNATGTVPGAEVKR